MDRIEIAGNELIAEAIDKLIEKYKKKAEKERGKIKEAKVTYQGMTYTSEAELMDAYSCDVFTDKVYDRLLDKLNKARGSVDAYAMTESEMLLVEFNKHKNSLLAEVAHDKAMKLRQEEIDLRIKGLVEQGYSIREAETIIGNEELMRFE